MDRAWLTADERAVYRRYARLPLPRHTSYPGVPFWSADFGPGELGEALAEVGRERRALSLYVHIPFCERLCYYCACTKEIVPPARHRQDDPADAYLAALAREAELFARAAGPGEVRQVHLGGGSPTFLSPGQLERLMGLLRQRFAIPPSAEVAVEIDPRITSREHLACLRALGFNRASLGVQDFDPRVQAAVNRAQPFEQVAQSVAWCRELGFDSLNFDLIYGLPFQTLDSLAATLEQSLRLAPDRVAFYRLAVIPEIFRWQNVFAEEDLPQGDLVLDLNLLAIRRFTEAGYEFIGLDHFARPGEALAAARRDRTLRRTFQGMTTGRGLEILGLGPSAISQLDSAFAQNARTAADWQRQLDRGNLATVRGLRLSADDRLRRELLGELYGFAAIDPRRLEHGYGVSFADYFAPELAELARLEQDGLVVAGPDRIELTEPLGRLLVRVVAAVFDRYLPPDAYRRGLSPRQASAVG